MQEGVLEANEIPKCEKCNSSSVYTKIDGSIVCRRCGHITKRTNGNS